MDPSWYFSDETTSIRVLRVGSFAQDLNLRHLGRCIFLELRLYVLLKFALALSLYAHGVVPETIVVLLDHLVKLFLGFVVLLLNQVKVDVKQAINFISITANAIDLFLIN